MLGPVAYLLGRWSSERIAAAPAELKGAGLARAGRVAGVAVTAIWALVLAFYVFQIVSRVLNSA